MVILTLGSVLGSGVVVVTGLGGPAGPPVVPGGLGISRVVDVAYGFILTSGVVLGSGVVVVTGLGGPAGPPVVPGGLGISRVVDTVCT